MPEGVFAIRWRTIDISRIPFPASETLTFGALTNGETLHQTGILRYMGSEFADIWFLKSGGNTPLQICFGPAQVGQKVKLYINFGSLYYEYEVQVWAAGCWTVRNPGSGSATPGAITFGNPVDIFSDFNPGEADPGFPPPTYNPFFPRLVISLDQDLGVCMESEKYKVTINRIESVNVLSATASKDGVTMPGIGLTQLEAGVLFVDPGDYQISIYYQYKGDPTYQIPNPPTEQMTREFHISKIPFPHTQRQSLTYGFLIPGEKVRFNQDILADDNTVEYNITTGEFTLRFCGFYFIKWFIAPKTGFTVDGANLAVAVNGVKDVIGSGHTKAPAVTGFSIVKVDGPPAAVSLVNVSGDIIVFSQAAQVKAGIVIFRIDDGKPLIGENGISTESEAVMALSYLELEKKNEPADALVVVNPGDAVVFDDVVLTEGSKISYDNTTGAITFNEEGFYYFDWYVAPQFGLTTDGSNWAVQTTPGGLSIVGSSHIKVSPTIGFAVIHAMPNETARLVNVSGDALTLSQAVQSQAALVVYSVAVMNSAP